MRGLSLASSGAGDKHPEDGEEEVSEKGSLDCDELVRLGGDPLSLTGEGLRRGPPVPSRVSLCLHAYHSLLNACTHQDHDC